jgi:hypothetical protein
MIKEILEEIKIKNDKLSPWFMGDFNDDYYIVNVLQKFKIRNNEKSIKFSVGQAGYDLIREYEKGVYQ